MGDETGDPARESLRLGLGQERDKEQKNLSNLRYRLRMPQQLVAVNFSADTAGLGPDPSL
jgi:hypothetical protein